MQPSRPFPVYRVPLKDRFVRSAWLPPALWTYFHEPIEFGFAAPDEHGPGIWSPGGHGRRFGVMLARSLVAVGVTPRALERSIRRRARRRDVGNNNRWQSSSPKPEVMIRGLLYGTRRPVDLPRESWMWDVLSNIFAAKAFGVPGGQRMPGPAVDGFVRYAADFELWVRDFDRQIDFRTPLREWLTRYCMGLMVLRDTIPRAFIRSRAEQRHRGLWDVLADGQARVQMRRTHNEMKRLIELKDPTIGSGIAFGRDWPLSDSRHRASFVDQARKTIEENGFLNWRDVREWADVAAAPDIADILLFLGGRIFGAPSLNGRAMSILLPIELQATEIRGRNVPFEILPLRPPEDWKPPNAIPKRLSPQD
jgi:hypothetical protein